MNELEFIIEEFIANRLSDKLGKLKPDDPKYEELKVQHQPINWLTDAAKRVLQIQMVSNSAKYHHQKSLSASVNINAPASDDDTFVSTRTLKNITYDVVGNAAALDVFKFLELEHDNETILQRILRNDPELRAAFPGSKTDKDNFFTSFAGIMQSNKTPRSHELAKQVYFPMGDEQYHLLSPLFPTSLAHALYEDIQTVNFAEEYVAVRQAKKAGVYHEQAVRIYPNLAIQTFGGSKPQNISQLNSRRGGKTYLLSSLPPIWQAFPVKLPLNRKSFFLLGKDIVKEELADLVAFLAAVKDMNNIKIRRTRADKVDAIVTTILLHAGKVQRLEPVGWSKREDCLLSTAQQFWLDPRRANRDEEWRQQRAKTNWQEQVASDFAKWLNGSLNKRLKKLKLTFAKAEALEWQELFYEALHMITEVQA